MPFQGTTRPRIEENFQGILSGRAEDFGLLLWKNGHRKALQTTCWTFRWVNLTLVNFFWLVFYYKLCRLYSNWTFFYKTIELYQRRFRRHWASVAKLAELYCSQGASEQDRQTETMLAPSSSKVASGLHWNSFPRKFCFELFLQAWSCLHFPITCLTSPARFLNVK